MSFVMDATWQSVAVPSSWRVDFEGIRPKQLLPLGSLLLVGESPLRWRSSEPDYQGLRTPRMVLHPGPVQPNA